MTDAAYISIQDYAKLMSLSVSTIRRMIRQKQIRAVQRGKHCSWRIALKDMASFEKHNSNVSR